MKELPQEAPGHWETAEGREIAVDYLGKTRADLAKGYLPDFVVANGVFLANRGDLNLIHWQTAAKERIRWLSAQLAAALSTLTNLSPSGVERDRWQPIETAPKDGRLILLCWPNWEQGVRVSRWLKNAQAWTWDGSHHYRETVGEPTFWQPLPSPPALTLPSEPPQRKAGYGWRLSEAARREIDEAQSEKLRNAANLPVHTLAASEPPSQLLDDRCELCHTSAPSAFVAQCNRSECPHRAPSQGDVEGRARETWEALKLRCAADPKKALRLVMVSKEDVEAAVALASKEDGRS